jgi:Spy/CpxP family protein refolding chaperone
MLRALTPIVTAALFAASTALLAQQTTPAPAPKADKGERHFDCSKAKDPKACEERRDKARAAVKKAHAACDAKKGDERRDCMRKEMCASSKDPAKCEASAKERMEIRKKAFEACKAKGGDIKACMREQRGRDKGDKK